MFCLIHYFWPFTPPDAELIPGRISPGDTDDAIGDFADFIDPYCSLVHWYLVEADSVLFDDKVPHHELTMHSRSSPRQGFLIGQLDSAPARIIGVIVGCQPWKHSWNCIQVKLPIAILACSGKSSSISTISMYFIHKACVGFALSSVWNILFICLGGLARLAFCILLLRRMA